MQSRKTARSERKAASEKRSAPASRGTGRAARSKQAPLVEDEARRRLAASSKLYYRIGEVSELTGVKAHVLRYWETEFRWMAPPKSRSKQRLYRKRDIEFVWLLKKLLWDQRFTIAGARQRIQELGLEEALARGGDQDTLGEAASIAALTAPTAPVSGTGLATDHDGACLADGSSGAPSSGGSVAADGDWLGIQVALESMQAELLALRGVLQQGL